MKLLSLLGALSVLPIQANAPIAELRTAAGGRHVSARAPNPIAKVQDADQDGPRLCHELASHVSLSDLRMSASAFEKRIQKVAESSGRKLIYQSWHPGAVVQGRPEWHVVIVRGAYGDYRGVLLRPRARRVQVVQLPEDVFGGVDVLAAKWSLRDGLLVGVGHGATAMSGPPRGGLAVIDASGAKLHLVQFVQTNNELSYDDDIGWDPRNPKEVIAIVREERFRSWFEVPHAGTERTRRFRWRFEHGRFRLVSQNVIDNGIDAFDAIVAAQAHRRNAELSRLIPNPSLRSKAVRAIEYAEREGWRSPISLAGGSEADDSAFTLRPDDGSASEAATFYFARVGGHCRLVKVSDGRRLHPFSSDPIARRLEIGLEPRVLGWHGDAMFQELGFADPQLLLTGDEPHSGPIQRVRGRRDMVIVRIFDRQEKESAEGMEFQTFGRNYLLFLDRGELCARPLSDVDDQGTGIGCLVATAWRRQGDLLVGIGKADHLFQGEGAMCGAVQVFRIDGGSVRNTQTVLYNGWPEFQFARAGSMDVRVTQRESIKVNGHYSKTGPFREVHQCLRFEGGRYVRGKRPVKE